jgi:glycosyltransferase involved in cell wall biosynthesis
VASSGEPTGRVLVALHESILGGASRAVARVVPVLEARGWQFEFWADRPSELHGALTARKWTVHGVPRELRYSWSSLREPPGLHARLRSLPRYLSEFRRLAASGRFALVHANTLLTIPEALSVRRAGPPTVLHVHEMLPRGAKGRTAAWLARAAADEVVAVSRASRDSLRARGVNASVAYNGIAVPEAPASAPDRRSAVVGTLGTVSRRKGSDLFVEAAKSIRERVPGVELRLVGPCARGPERPWAEAVVERAVDAGIVYVPYAEPADELPRLDVFVLPTREDPFPLVVLEAMAAGLPIVATSVGGVPEQLGGGAGRLVPPEDVASLADAVTWLLERPEERERLGPAAWRAVARFSLERQADALEASYQMAMARRTRRAPGLG